MAPNNNKNNFKSEKNLKDAPLPPLPFSNQTKKKEEAIKKGQEVDNIAKKEGPLTVEEASTLLENLTNKQDILKQMLDDMFQKRGISPQYLRIYMSNPNNFTSEEWENIQSHRQELMATLNLPPEAMEQSKATPIQSGSAFTESTTDKDRRSKLGSARRRGWLPMR